MRGTKVRAINKLAYALIDESKGKRSGKNFVEATMRKFRNQKNKKEYRVWGQVVHHGYRAVRKTLKRQYRDGLLTV